VPLLLVLLLQGQSAPRDLIKQLRSDRAETRDRATTALKNLGQEAVPDLLLAPRSAPRSAKRRPGTSSSTGAQGDLFMMRKQGREWQFGTVTSHGTRVIQSGQIENCLSCHRSAKPDPVFGLPGSP
jgi:hypothetical protein